MEAPTFQVIKDAIENNAKAFEAFKDTNDKRIDAVKTGNETLAKELDTKLTKIEADLKKYNDIKTNWEVEMNLFRERVEELESRAKSPGKTATEKLRDDHKGAFITWMRNKAAMPEDERKLRELELKMIETKDITVG